MSTLLQIRPIVVALRRHKAAVSLLVLEIALTMAVLSNLVFIVCSDIQRAYTPTGIAEDQIGVIQSIGVIGNTDSNTAGENLAILRTVSGVEAAAFGGPPLWNPNRIPIFLNPVRQNPTLQAYELLGSQDLSRALGLRFVQGHEFIDSDLPDITQVLGGDGDKRSVIPVVITRSLAHRLYNTDNPLGRLLYTGTSDMRVIGVLNHLRGELTGRTDDDYSLVVEAHVGPQHLGGGFMIRTRDPTRLTQTLRAAATALQKANPGHVQANVFTFPELRDRYFRQSLAIGHMLIAITAILVVVSALGVSGLASFWVQQRSRQIGMRRVLGATRSDIVRYFQIENFLIVGAGAVFGAICAYALNVFLMQRFGVPRLALSYVMIAAAVLWLLGQVAVMAPVLRAAAVPPAVATRTM